MNTEDKMELILRLFLFAMLLEYVGEIWTVRPDGRMFDIKYGV